MIRPMSEVRRFSSLLALNRPVEFIDRLSGWLDQGRSRQLVPPDLAPTHADPVQAAHQYLAIGACADCLALLPEVRAAVAGRLARLSHQDAGMALAEMLWVLVRHLRPERVVETGVARGISSAFTLDALTRNGTGHLWSIDLPPLGGDWASQVAVAVDPAARQRWTYIRGASQRKLPGLLARLGSVDLFTHDGLHTRKNQDREYRTAWPYIRAGGFLVSDDVNFSDAFVRFAGRIGQEPVLIREPAKHTVIGFLRREAAGRPAGSGPG
jgi:predicted O-methyltransferase YrrM